MTEAADKSRDCSRHFFPRRICQAASQEVSGGQGKARAPEWWPESSGRGLDDDFLIEAFFYQACSFSVPGHPKEEGLLDSRKEEGLLDYLGRLGVAGSSVEISRLVWLLIPADFSLQEVSSCDQGDRRRSGEAQRPRTSA